MTHFKLIKEDGSVKNIYGEVVHDYVVCMGKTVFSKEMLEQKGLLQKAMKTPKFADATSDLLECAFRVGENKDGSKVEIIDDKAIARRREEERKAEREKQNLFLKEKGYLWKKEVRYNPFHENENEEFTNVWVLRSKDGIEIKDVENLLIDLGYFGQEAIEKRDRKIQAKKEKQEAIEKIERFFRENKGECPEKVDHIEGQTYHIEGKGHDIYGGGTGYILTKDAIWRIENNGGDGDDWSRNNYKTGGAGAIAVKYNFNQEIAEKISMLSKGL